MSARELITEHLDLWTGAVTKKSSSGRGSNGKVELTGIKKLRELILELAVRGRLVEQNPADEPASKLLERVRAEKLHLVKQGEIKKRRKLPELSEMTIPFHLPSSWEWGQLEDVGRDWGQKAPSNEFSYIDVASVDNLRGATTQPSILSADEAPSRARKIVREGTLIYSTIRPYLQNIAVVESEIEPEPIASTAFAVLHPLAGMPARFFLHYLRSPAFVRYVESAQTGIAYPAINDKQFFSGLVPVPPLEEQHRIVQKVDELMALCDRLEKQTSDQLEAHETLVDTLFGTLTQSQNATELADNWARLAAHFDTLFTTEQSIDKLKQTILQLAVMGRLVEQDAEDEPIIDYLNSHNINATNHEQSGWAQVRLGDLGEIIGGATPSKKNPEFWQGEIPWVSPKDMKTDQISDSQDHVSKEAITNSPLRRIPPQSLLMVVRGMILAHSFPVAITTAPVTINQDMKALVPPSDISQYLLLFLKARKATVTDLVDRSSHGTCKLKSEKLWALPIDLPPIREQERILSRVDELMALCDQVKERLNQASETRCQLAEAIVQKAVS